MKEILNNGATEKNSLLHFTLADKASGEIVATNFLLLDKIKKSEQITNPHLQVTIFRHVFLIFQKKKRNKSIGVEKNTSSLKLTKKH